MEYNEVAAKWWADRLRNISLGNFNNGDSSPAGAIDMMMATMIAMDNQSSSEAIDLFEKKLAETIKKQMETHSSIILSVDSKRSSVCKGRLQSVFKDYLPDRICWRIIHPYKKVPHAFIRIAWGAFYIDKND